MVVQGGSGDLIILMTGPGGVLIWVIEVMVELLGSIFIADTAPAVVPQGMVAPLPGDQDRLVQTGFRVGQDNHAGLVRVETTRGQEGSWPW